MCITCLSQYYQSNETLHEQLNRLLKVQDARGHRRMQSFCSTTGSSWRSGCEDGLLLPCLYSADKSLPSSLASPDSRVAHLNARNATVSWRRTNARPVRNVIAKEGKWWNQEFTVLAKSWNIRWTMIKKNNLVRMENCEMFDDIAFFHFFNLSKLWICKEHHSSVDVLEINIGLQKRCIHDLWTNNMQAFPLTHLWRIKKKGRRPVD